MYYAVIALIQIGLWVYLYNKGTKIARTTGYRKGRNDGFQEAVKMVNAGVKKEINQFILNNGALPGVPLTLTRCEDHYHASMDFANIHAESVLPPGWEILPPDKKRQMVMFIRKELAADLVKAGINLSNNQGGNNAKVF